MYMGILAYKPWLLRISRCADSLNYCQFVYDVIDVLSVDK